MRGKFSPYDAMSRSNGLYNVKFSSRPKMPKVGRLIDGLLEQAQEIAGNPKMESKGLVR